MDVDSLAQQLVSSGPEQLIQVLGRVDEILTDQVGVSLADVIEASGLDEEEEEMAAEPSSMDAGVVDGGMVPYGSEMPAEAVSLGGRQRITLF